MNARTILTRMVRLWALGVCGLLIMGIFWGALNQGRVGASDVVACMNESPRQRESCLSTRVELVLTHSSTAHLMDELTDAPSGICHEIGHFVGRQTYKNTASIQKGIAACNGQCYFACEHGVVEQGFADTLQGPLQASDFESSHWALVRSEGRKLCAAGPDTCHGLGHALFYATRDTRKALQFCTSLSGGQNVDTCYSGVFMGTSNQQLLTASTSTERGNVQYSSRELLSSCDTVSPQYIVGCFQFLYLQQQVLFLHEGDTDFVRTSERRVAACETLHEPVRRSACFVNAGSSFAAYGPRVQLKDFCSVLHQGSDRASCFSGYSHFFTLLGKSQEAVLFCETVPNDDKASCFEGIFSTVPRAHVFEPSKILCPDVRDGVCARVRQRNLNDVSYQKRI